MKMLCVASDEPGHLDFGGRGYMRLADMLRARGHDVRWICAGAQAAGLRSAGYTVIEFQPVNGLSFTKLLQYAHSPAIERDIVPLLAQFRALVSDADIALVDRRLVFAAMALEEAGIPLAAVGTPGGTWYRERGMPGLAPRADPVDAYLRIGEALKRELRWSRARLGSCWVDSPWLNLAFLGRSFFPPFCLEHAALVRHYDERPASASDRIGVSFGNSGNPALMARALKLIADGLCPGESVVAFAGRREQLAESLRESCKGDRRIEVRGWVPFEEALGELGCLVSFGGVGTLWQCVNHGLPMGLVPGRAGDQHYNGARVAALGMGLVLDPGDPHAFGESMKSLREPERFRACVAQFKATQNYTDDLASACARLESSTR